MKLVRFGPKGQEKPGLVDSTGNIRDASQWVSDWQPQSFEQGCKALQGMNLETLPKVDQNTRLGVPLNGIGKIVGIGLNYKDHAKEAGLPIPEEPIMFLKATSGLNGPNDDIELPLGSATTDWEVELGVVMAKDAKNVSLDDAMSYVFGYTISNDVSERTFQLERGTQWTKGKSADTFSPLGPWLVTKDEVPDPQNLDLKLWLNGELMQRGNSQEMVFGVAELVHRISQYTTLKAGDVLTTGTPPGVGFGMKPPRYMKAGDSLRLVVEGLGEQNAKVVALW